MKIQVGEYQFSDLNEPLQRSLLERAAYYISQRRNRIEREEDWARAAGMLCVWHNCPERSFSDDYIRPFAETVYRERLEQEARDGITAKSKAEEDWALAEWHMSRPFMKIHIPVACVPSHINPKRIYLASAPSLTA